MGVFYLLCVKRRSGLVKVKISGKRIEQLITEINSFNLTEGCGVTRPTFSFEYLKACKYLTKIMGFLGLRVRATRHGNIIAIWEGKTDAPGILVGSHIDSVPHGGKFDGVAGVVAAIEAVQSLKESGYTPYRPVYIAIFAEEEGTTFGHLLAGSQAFIGRLDDENLEALINKDGLNYLECANKFQKYFIPSAFDILTKDIAMAMIELHIEQSIVLDNQGLSIGIVKGIAGTKQFLFKVKGRMDHAGATPMTYRQDALAGAAEAIIKVEKIVKAFSSKTAVATCGAISSIPGVPNVISGETTFSLDIRDTSIELLEEVTKEIMTEIMKIMENRNLILLTEQLSKTEPVSLDNKLISLLHNIATENQIDTIEMFSGALHDSSSIAQVLPTGMIFVPSVNGISHSPDEFTKTEDIVVGCTILAEAIKSLSSKLSS